MVLFEPCIKRQCLQDGFSVDPVAEDAEPMELDMEQAEDRGFKHVFISFVCMLIHVDPNMRHVDPC